MVDSNSVASISAASPKQSQRGDRRAVDFLCVICLETFDPRTAAIIARHQNKQLLQQDQQSESSENQEINGEREIRIEQEEIT